MRITIYRRYNEYISLDFGPPELDKIYDFLYNENIKWLYKLINWDKFISTGMYEWCKEENLLQEHDDKHPSEEGHKKYTEQFIEPHLNARSII